MRCEAQPDCTHEDGETDIHGDADAVGDDVAVGFDEVTVQKGEEDRQGVGAVMRMTDIAGWTGGFVLDFLNEDGRLMGFGPCNLDLLELLCGFFTISHEVCVYEFNNVFCWIDVVWHFVADRIEVVADACDRAIVGGLAGGEEKEFVEESECSSRWLVDARDYDDLYWSEMDNANEQRW